MQTFTKLTAISAALSIQSLAGAGIGYEIADRNTSATFGENGQVSWIVDGTEQLFEQSFYFRTGTMDFERRVDSQSLELVGTFMTDTNPFRDDRNDAFGSLYANDAGLQIETIFTIRGSNGGNADLAEQITLRNLSNESMTVSFFQFVDFDLGGDADDDTGMIVNGNTIRQSDDVASVAETVVTPQPNAYTVGDADLIRAMLSDDNADTLDNTASYAGNVGWSFQWNITLGAGQSFIISKDKSIVPAPGAFALLGAAGATIVPARRRRRS